MLSNHTEQQVPKERDSCYPSTSERTKKAVRRATLEQGEGKRWCSGRPEGMNLRIVMNMSAGITMVTSTLFPYTAGKCYCQKYALRCNKTEWINLGMYNDSDGTIRIFVHVLVRFPHEHSKIHELMT